MNVKKLNVTELSSEELVKISGGRIKPYTDADFIRDHGATIFAVTRQAQNKLWYAAFS